MAGPGRISLAALQMPVVLKPRAAPGTLLPFEDLFERPNGPVGNGWTGPGWSILEGKASNDPALGEAGRFLVRRFAAVDVCVEVDWRILDSGMPCGLVLGLDDPDAPLNYVAVSMLEGEIDFYSVTGGVVSSVYFDESQVGLLRLEKQASQYRLFLDDALLTTATLTDPALQNNRWHGALSTGGYTYAQLASIRVTRPAP